MIFIEGVPHLGAGSGEDVTRAGQDLTCKRSLYGKVCDDNAVALVLAPGVKQLPGEATLQHGRRGQHHAGAHIIQAALALQLRDIFKVEWIGALRHSNCVKASRQFAWISSFPIARITLASTYAVHGMAAMSAALSGRPCWR